MSTTLETRQFSSQRVRLRTKTKKVIITGSSASGKSVLARQLGNNLAIEVIHLDSFYWQPGSRRTRPAQWRSVVTELTRREAWIIEGNYSGTLDIQLTAADTIIFLDLPRRLCLWRAFKRWLCSTGKFKTDRTRSYPNQLSWSFLKSIWSYPTIKRPLIIQQLVQHAKRKQVIILKQPAEVRDFLVELFKHDRLPVSAPSSFVSIPVNW